MRATAVCAATGEPYRRWARLLSERMNRLCMEADHGTTALPCVDISEMVPWSTLPTAKACKGFAWDYVPDDIEVVVWMDADTFPMRAIYTSELPQSRLVALNEPLAMLQRTRRGIKPRRRSPWNRSPYDTREVFCGTGVIVAKRSTRPVFEDLKKRAQEIKDQGFARADADLFNMALHDNGVPFEPLPPVYNCAAGSDIQNPAIVHFMRGTGYRWALEMLYRVARCERDSIELSNPHHITREGIRDHDTTTT